MEPLDYLLDLIDVALVTWVFYRLLLVFRQTRAIRVLAGLGVLALAYMVARFFRFEGFLGLVDLLRGNRLEIGIVILAVIFADEIKDAFSGVLWRLGDPRKRTPDEEVVDHVSRACQGMAARRCGALIAIARQNPLDRWEIADSVPIDAAVGAGLIETIFVGKTPLHDGAMIIRDGRIVAAKCQLPQTNNPAVTKRQVGLRHRAAFGLSESSDAVVVVVSEERGTIGVAHRGKLTSPIEPADLPDVLRDLLGVAATPRSWYHPTRLAANAPIKLAAVVLAAWIWGEQLTIFPVTAPVQVLASPSGAGRQVRLEPGRHVVVNDGHALVERARDQDGTPLYEQALPAVTFELSGRNFARLALLPRLVPGWIARARLDADPLLGGVGVELPTEVGAAPARLPLRRTALADAFTLVPQDVVIETDVLEALDARTIRVVYTGQPPEDYVVLSASPLAPTLPGAQRLVVPKAQRKAVEAALNPCPTWPPISIAGRTEFAETVELQVPDALRRWNPGHRFEAHVIIEILAAKALRDAQAQQLSDAQRQELEALRQSATQQAREARERWADLERRFKDASWEQGYRLEPYQTLVSRTIPELERRVENAARDLDAVERQIRRLSEEVDAGTRSEQEIARARLSSARRERQWRQEIHEALGIRLDLLEREQQAVYERLRPLFTAVEDAQREAQEAASGELATISVDSENDLRGLIDTTGPTGAARTEGARAIVRAASARSAIALYASAITSFERRLDAAREVATLIREQQDLAAQLAAPPSPGFAPIRVELQLAERAARLERRRRQSAREVAQWKELQPKLAQQGDMLGQETAMLERIARSWSPEEARALELGPFVALARELAREVVLEPPAAYAAEAFLRTERQRVQDPELLQDLEKAHVAWLGEAGQPGYLERLRRRLMTLTLIALRLATDAPPANPFEAEDQALAVADDARAQARARLAAYDAQSRAMELDDLDERQAALARVQEDALALRQARERAQAALVAQAGALSRVEQGATEPEARLAAANALRDMVRLVYAHERLRRLDAQRIVLEALVAKVQPVIEPIRTTYRARLAEIERTGQSVIAERQSALDYLVGRHRERELLAMLAMDVGRLAEIAEDDRGFGERVVLAFAPLGDDDRGVDHLVALHARREVALERLGTLRAPVEGIADADIPPVARPAHRTMLDRLRAQEVAMREARLAVIEDAIEELRRELFDSGPLERIIDAIEQGLTPAAARALASAPLEFAAEQLAAALVLRRAQQDEARRAATERPDPAERATFERRTGILQKRITRLEELTRDLARLRAKVAELAPAPPPSPPPPPPTPG